METWREFRHDEGTGAGRANNNVLVQEECRRLQVERKRMLLLGLEGHGKGAVNGGRGLRPRRITPAGPAHLACVNKQEGAVHVPPGRT